MSKDENEAAWNVHAFGICYAYAKDDLDGLISPSWTQCYVDNARFEK